jgi:nitrate/TMAO reductase-like tetraheme cytochrome c subunit
MASFEKFRENWVRPALFFGNNPISLVGGALTSGSAVIMLSYWVTEMLGSSSNNPYLGIIFFLILPMLFIAGLVLIPIGVFLRYLKLQKQGTIPKIYPKIDFNDRAFRHGVDIVLIATMVNILIVAISSYRGAAYMDSPQFCGQACHVMHPEYAAYQVSPHSHVECVSCHIGSGAKSYVEAKVNGTKQLVEVTFHTYPTPIPSPVASLRPALAICENCHTPAKFIGDKLIVRSYFGDDEANTKTQSIVLLHLGGRDSVSRLTGIHGAHLGHIEYVSTDKDRQTIPWVEKHNTDGTIDTYADSKSKSEPTGERRLMDCIDCHNRAAHSMQTAEEALSRSMDENAVSPELPFVHKEGLVLLRASYNSEAEAREKIPAGLVAFYQKEHPEVLAQKAALVKAAGDGLVQIYTHNVFPEMKVTWGTHPNNIGHNGTGHNDYAGCYRCHDGDHSTKGSKVKTIPNDCDVCHNLLAVDEANPKVLKDLGIK